MMATGALGPQKPVGQNPATQILFKLFDHEIWKWVPQVLFDLALEREPMGLDQVIECSLFGFVALSASSETVQLRLPRRNGKFGRWVQALADLVSTTTMAS